MCVCVLLLDLFWFFSSVLCGCCCYRLVLYSKSILICVWYETVTLRYIMYTIAQLWILTKSKWKLNVMSQCNSSINSIKMPKDSFVFINFGFFCPNYKLDQFILFMWKIIRSIIVPYEEHVTKLYHFLPRQKYTKW